MGTIGEGRRGGEKGRKQRKIYFSVKEFFKNYLETGKQTNKKNYDRAPPLLFQMKASLSLVSIVLTIEILISL